MDFWVILYSLICVVVGGGAISFLYKRNQSIAAMITLVLLLLVFILYGLRWFPGGNLNGTKPVAVPWPPIVNLCPDFMVSWKDGSKVYCYDAANIYSLKTITNNNLESQKTINGVQGQSAILLQNASGTTPQTKNPLQNILKTNPSAITGDRYTSLIRWEGVWDGRLTTPDRIPSI
jgi:hypothetical protein